MLEVSCFLLHTLILASKDAAKRKECTENCLSQPSAAYLEGPNSALKLVFQNRIKDKERLVSHPFSLSSVALLWVRQQRLIYHGLHRNHTEVQGHQSREMRRHCISPFVISQIEAGQFHPLLWVRDFTLYTAPSNGAWDDVLLTGLFPFKTHSRTYLVSLSA